LSNTNFKIIPNSKNLNKNLFKIIKKSNQKGFQIVFQKELRNPDSPFTWRYIGAMINPRRAQQIQKIVLLFFVHSFINIFGEN